MAGSCARLQEVNQSWDKSPTIAGNVGALSQDCRDLLDKIFVVDPKERITVAEIMKHSWFCQPLEEPFAGTLEKMRSQNQALAQHMSNRTLDQVRPCYCGHLVARSGSRIALAKGSLKLLNLQYCDW